MGPGLGEKQESAPSGSLRLCIIHQDSGAFLNKKQTKKRRLCFVTHIQAENSLSAPLDPHLTRNTSGLTDRQTF